MCLSHARPIPGGLSGTLLVELEATSPVLFGMEGEHSVSVPARLHDGADAPYVMPARAARGFLRSVFRIATFSALSPINGHIRLAGRHMDYRNRIRGIRASRHDNRRRCGWLRFDFKNHVPGFSGWQYCETVSAEKVYYEDLVPQIPLDQRVWPEDIWAKIEKAGEDETEIEQVTINAWAEMDHRQKRLVLSNWRNIDTGYRLKRCATPLRADEYLVLAGAMHTKRKRGGFSQTFSYQ